MLLYDFSSYVSLTKGILWFTVELQCTFDVCAEVCAEVVRAEVHVEGYP